MKFLISLSLVVALAFGGCAQLGGVAPQSLDESLAVAEAQVTGLEQSAASALTAGTIHKADAQEVLLLSDQAISAISAARASEKLGDMTTAQGKLSMATAFVAQLASYLTAHGVK